MYDSNSDDNTTMICNILLYILHIYIYSTMDRNEKRFDFHDCNVYQSGQRKARHHPKKITILWVGFPPSLVMVGLWHWVAHVIGYAWGSSHFFSA